MLVAVVTPLTGRAGSRTERLLKVPSPSCPNWFDPTQSVPSGRRTQVWFPPPDTAVGTMAPLTVNCCVWPKEMVGLAGETVKPSAGAAGAARQSQRPHKPEATSLNFLSNRGITSPNSGMILSAFYGEQNRVTPVFSGREIPERGIPGAGGRHRPRSDNGDRMPSVESRDAQEAGGDRPRRSHSDRTGRARDRVAFAPAREEVEETRSRRQGHHRAAVVGSRAGRPAVDRSVARGHGAAAETRLVDVEREAL